MTNNYQNGGGNDEQEDIKEIMENQGLDADQAEKVRDVMEEYTDILQKFDIASRILVLR